MPDPSDDMLGVAVAHPLRRRALEALGAAELSAVQLARRLQADAAVIHYHLKKLDRLGLIEPASPPRRSQPPGSAPRGGLSDPFRARYRVRLDATRISD